MWVFLMENKVKLSKINKVRKDLRALKSSSHAIERLIDAQGIHFVRINALEALPCSEKTRAIIENEREIVRCLGLTEEIERNERLEKQYMGAISALDLTDRALVTDYYVKGMPCYRVAMEYGFSEGGLRKRLDRLVVKIAESM